MKCIHYAAGYTYQLRRTYETAIEIKPAQPIRTTYIDLDPDGLLTILQGYAWDGPSRAFDTPSFMRGSLVHDATYQLIRDGHIDSAYREKADETLRRMCLEDGMWKARAWWVYHAVRKFGGPSADPAKASPDLCAPATCVSCSTRS